jgi:hypothetical protein
MCQKPTLFKYYTHCEGEAQINLTPALSPPTICHSMPDTGAGIPPVYPEFIEGSLRGVLPQKDDEPARRRLAVGGAISTAHPELVEGSPPLYHSPTALNL